MTSKGIRKLISLTPMKKKKRRCTHNGMYITNIKYLCLWCRVTEYGMNGQYGIQDNKTHPKQLGRKDTMGQLAAAISPYMSSLQPYITP